MRFIKNPSVAYALFVQGFTVTPHNKLMVFPCGCGDDDCAGGFDYTQSGYRVDATKKQLDEMGFKSSNADTVWYAY